MMHSEEGDEAYFYTTRKTCTRSLFSLYLLQESESDRNFFTIWNRIITHVRTKYPTHWNRWLFRYATKSSIRKLCTVATK